MSDFVAKLETIGDGFVNAVNFYRHTFYIVGFDAFAQACARKMNEA
jgi:hypothetical protein